MRPECDILEVTKFLQNFIPGAVFRSQIGNEAAFLIPDTNLTVFPEMLDALERSMENLKLDEYGLAISALDEVYVNVCAIQASEGIDFNLELINCNKFRLHTGIRKYLVQWKAMLYKRYLFTCKPPILFIIQSLIITIFAILACIRSSDITPNTNSPLNISLDLYKDVTVWLKMSNDTEVKLKMQPLAFFMEEYFRKFQTKSTLAFIGENMSTANVMVKHTDELCGTLDVKDIGAFEFQNTENVSIYFNNLPFHSIPIMVLLWINLIVKFELGESYNVEIVNKPQDVRMDYLKAIDVDSNNYAVFTSLGLSVAFAFFNYVMTRGRASRQVLLQLLGGLRVSTYWLSNVCWDLTLIIIFVSVIVVISVLFGSELTKDRSKIVELYFILVNLGLGVLLFSYLNAFFSKDPFRSVAFSALKDIICALIVFNLMVRLQKDNFSPATKGFINFTNDILKINPTFGTISILYKMSKIGKTNTSCEEACRILSTRFPLIYEDCSPQILCAMELPLGRKICCCE